MAMGMKIKRPLLVGGLGLTASAWMLNIVQHSIFNETTLLSAIALSSGLWWWQRQRQPLLLDLAGVVDEAAVKTAFAQIDTAIETLAREIETVTSAKMSAIALDSLRSQRQALEPMLNRDTLHIGILGNKGTGKTALAAYLNTHWRLSSLRR